MGEHTKETLLLPLKVTDAQVDCTVPDNWLVRPWVPAFGLVFLDALKDGLGTTEMHRKKVPASKTSPNAGEASATSNT